MKDFVLTVLFYLSTPNSSPGGLGPRSRTRQRQAGQRSSARRAARGPGNKGRLRARGGPGGSQGTLSERPQAATRHPFPGATTPARNLPAAASRAPPAPRPPPQVGRPRQPIAKLPSMGGGACAIGSDVKCSAGRGVSRSSPPRPAEPAEAGEKHGSDPGRREISGCGGDRGSRSVR